jgi:hypothetical protein
MCNFNVIIVIMSVVLFLTGYLKKRGVWEKGNSRNVCSYMNVLCFMFPTIICTRICPLLPAVFDCRLICTLQGIHKRMVRYQK